MYWSQGKGCSYFQWTPNQSKKKQASWRMGQLLITNLQKDLQQLNAELQIQGSLSYSQCVHIGP